MNTNAEAGAYGRAADAPLETMDPPLAPQRIIRPLRPLVPWTIALAALYLVFTVAGRLVAAGDPMLVGTLAFAGFPVTIGLIVLGGLFFIRAGDNADRLGARDRTWGTYWGMLSWVIPVANAVLPWLYVRELWKASAPNAGPADWRDMAVPGWMVVWWAAWGGAQLLGVVTAVMGYAVALRASFRAVRAGTPEAAASLVQPTWLVALQWTSVALIAVALPFFIKLLLALPERQEARARNVPAQPRDAAPPPTGTF